MVKEFDTGTCEKISTSFELSKNKGFIPLFTKVYLDLQDGHFPNQPFLKTPEHLTDASIPVSKPFEHSKGLLFYKTYLSYKPLETLSQKELEKRVNALKFSYKVYDCNGGEKEFNEYDFEPYYVASKKLVYFVNSIDLI